MAKISKRLLRALDSDYANEISQIIKDKKPEDFGALLSLLSLDSSVNPKHRSKAIYALGRWGDPAAVAPIRSILPHLNEMERISAIDALGRLGAQEALADILNYVNDESPDVRKFVVLALSRINTSEAQAQLKEVAAKDPIDYIRALATKHVNRSVDDSA